jgi:hypothetical protein
MGELWYSSDEIARFVADGAVAEELPEPTQAW